MKVHEAIPQLEEIKGRLPVGDPAYNYIVGYFHGWMSTITGNIFVVDVPKCVENWIINYTAAWEVMGK